MGALPMPQLSEVAAAASPTASLPQTQAGLFWPKEGIVAQETRWCCLLKAASVSALSITVDPAKQNYYMCLSNWFLAEASLITKWT